MSGSRRSRSTPEIPSAEQEQARRLANRRVEREERRAKELAILREAEKPILEELSSIGCEGEIWDLPKNYGPLSPEIVALLLKWLPRTDHDRVKESIVRALISTKEPFDGLPLIECFENDESDTLRWPIADTFASGRPMGISEWLVDTVQDPLSGTARQLLVLALARDVPSSVALPILRRLLDDLPGHVPAALAKIGSVPEIKLLQSRLNTREGWQRKEMEKAIRAIQRRHKKGGEQEKISGKRLNQGAMGSMASKAEGTACDGLVESSINFDAEDVRPFLERVSQLIEQGFGHTEVDQVSEMVHGMECEDEKELGFPIVHSGSESFFAIRVFLDDTDAPDVYFFGPPKLAEQIDELMDEIE